MTADVSMARGREPFDAAALVRAAGEGDAARVESLLAAGADVNAALEGGETALIRAASKGRVEVVRRLLEAGAAPDAEREDGFTALSVAVFFGHAEIVRALLEGGADPTARGRLGATAARWALLSGHGEIAELLRSHAAPGEAAPALFPEEGTFRPVVPLSKLDGRVADSASGVEDETREQEVVTVVRPRVSTPVAAPAVRPKLPRQPWSLTVLLLGLSVIAGVAAGAYLLRGWGTETQPPPPAVEASAEAENHPPAPAPSVVETKNEVAKETKSERASVVKSDPKPAPEENRRAPKSDPPARSEASTAPRPAPTKADAARRAAPVAVRRAQRTEARATNVSAREDSAPVFTPKTSGKSSRVVPWP